MNTQNQLIGRPMEILLVEDSLMDARTTMSALKKGLIHHRLTLIRDGEEALEFLGQVGRFARAPRPDLILLDLMLPKKSGMIVLDTIRGDFDLRGIPVVVLTASDDEQDRVKCQMLHIDAFITKPVNREKLLTVVRQLKKFWHNDVILPAAE